MPRQKITDEIETLRRQKAQIDVRLKAPKDRRKEHEAEEKKRRKLLLGGIILDFMLANPDTPTTQAIRDLLLKHATPRREDALCRPSFGSSENIAGIKKAAPAITPEPLRT